MKRIVENSRYMSVVGVVVLLVMSALAFLWNAKTAVEIIFSVFRSADQEALLSLYLIKLVDGILIAIVLMILALSVYSMFIGELELPAWMVAHNLEELKSKLSGVIVLVLAVRFLEYVLEGELASIELMWVGIAIAVVIAALIAFSVLIDK